MARIEGDIAGTNISGTTGDDIIYGYTTADADAAVTGLTLTEVASGAGTRVTVIEHAPGDSNHLFVVSAAGLIQVLNLDTGLVEPTPLLDLTGRVALVADGGLSGLAFHPDFAANGRFYVSYLAANPDGTRDTQVWEYTVLPDNPLVADPASARLVASYDNPGPGPHLSAWITFGPDGYLYLTIGDGANPFDPLMVAQDPNSPLGKILRIDVDGPDAFPDDPDRNFAIPPENPFADGEGGMPEIWGIGLRNAYRGSFDEVTGDFWNGDVGNDAWEEVNRVPAGTQSVNFGWGNEGYEGNEPVPGNTLPPDGLLFPVDTYAHADPARNYAVNAGYVYRGGSEGLQGQFFYADFAQGWLRTLSDPEGDGTYVRTDWTSSITYVENSGTLRNPSTFGEDAEGNLYITTIGGTIFRIEPTSEGPADGPDTINAGQGDDGVFAGGGDDSVKGGAAADSLLGMAGSDTLWGGVGDDSIAGGDGADWIAGQDDADTMIGGAGNDTLTGGGGGDLLDGGSGDDRLVGAAGMDLLRGGVGLDRFIFRASSDSSVTDPDTILDFEAGEKIAITQIVGARLAFLGDAAFSGTGVGEVRMTSQDYGSLVEADTNGDNAADMAIRVIGVSTLAASDFVL